MRESCADRLRSWSQPTLTRCSSLTGLDICWGCRRTTWRLPRGSRPEDRFGLAYLRADLPLAPGYVVTIEPGIYFVPALLTDPARRERYGGMVDWDVVDTLLDFGGIRIEAMP